MKYLRYGMVFTVCIIACLLAIQSMEKKTSETTLTTVYTPDTNQVSSKKQNSLDSLQSTSTPTPSDTKTPISSSQEYNTAASSRHEQQLAVLENEKFERYQEGNINFDLLRQTTLNRNPPPIFPNELKKLDGKTVKILGFMAPFDDIQNLSNFMLFPTFAGCFFCAPPSNTEVVLIRQNVEKADWIDGPILVEGTLSLWREKHPDSGHEIFLYIINDAKVTKYVEAKKP